MAIPQFSGCTPVRRKKLKTQPIQIIAQPFSPVFGAAVFPRTESRIMSLEVVDRRCWPRERGSDLDHYGVVIDIEVSAKPGDLVVLDVRNHHNREEVDWILARLDENGAFVDLRTGEIVPAEHSPEIHGRVFRQVWWLSEEALPANDESPTDESEWKYVHKGKRVSLKDVNGKELEGAFNITAPLNDFMSPACPKGEWVVFDSDYSDSPVGDIVLAGVEQFRTEPGFESTTFELIARLGRDKDGRNTLSTDQPGFFLTDGQIENGVETNFCILGHAVSFPVDLAGIVDQTLVAA